jgi:hypothetical protein
MTWCALGDQDAILGHVASRGDRFPRPVNRTLAGRSVNGQRAILFAIDHEQFSGSEGTFRRFDLGRRPRGRRDPKRKLNDAASGRRIDASDFDGQVRKRSEPG